MLKKPTSENDRSRILLVDDHPIVREGLAARLNQETDLVVSGLAASGEEAITKVSAEIPDLVIADLSLGGKAGLDLVKELQRLHPELPVLVLSIHDENLWAERVLLAGAKGYVMKSQATQNVVDAIRQLLGGGIWLSERMNAQLLQKYAKKQPPASDSPLATLTDRELEIFLLIGQGLGMRDIAARLSLSAKTVEVHREHIKEKLGLKNSAALLRYAVTYVMQET